jgi:hypothetical protein
VRPELEVLLSDCPCIEGAWPARIGQVEAVTRAIPSAFDRNSRLEVVMGFSDIFMSVTTGLDMVMSLVSPRAKLNRDLGQELVTRAMDRMKVLGIARLCF